MNLFNTCTEEGLASAVRCSDALYGGTTSQLGELSAAEVEYLFANAKMCELYLDSETTLLDVVMKANCFRYEGSSVF